MIEGSSSTGSVQAKPACRAVALARRRKSLPEKQPAYTQLSEGCRLRHPHFLLLCGLIDNMKVDNLITHPEGGRFQEVFRSEKSVTTDNGKTRSALTHIYFELGEGEVSRFHKVTSDEVWNLYEGEGALLYIWDDAVSTLETIELSSKNREFCHVVKAGMWQATKPLKGRVLIGCSVGPGFEFEDFELIDPESDIAEQILEADLTLNELVI